MSSSAISLAGAFSCVGRAIGLYEEASKLGNGVTRFMFQFLVDYQVLSYARRNSKEMS